MNMNKKDIVSYNLKELQCEMETLGYKAFRSKQIYEWIHVKLCTSFEQMSNLSKDIRAELNERYVIGSLDVVERQVSKKDGTNKFLFQLADNHVIESVLMRYKHGNSVCISTQVGCRMGCTFCASTIGGLRRNLTTSEMLKQVYEIQRLTEERVSNVVVMGTGEPLDNYDNFVKFVHMLSDEHGLHISQRNITVSTCGIVPMIQKLATEQLQITLALSLHGVTQEKRKAFMPIANKYDLKETFVACDEYYEKTKRRVSFEYSLVAGVNDTREDAKELSALLKGKNCHVNLIPVNPIQERSYERPTRENALQFKNKLEKNGINVTIRREMGTDIDGACGQLRQSYIGEE